MAAAAFLTPTVHELTVPVRQWIALQAELLCDAFARGDPSAIAVLRFAEVPTDMPPDARLTVDAAQLAVAKDHWYTDLADAVAHGDDTVDTRFEAAANAICAGDLDTLRALLDAEPALVGMHSSFPHRQTLLRHVTANGIEVERQLQSPANAPEVLHLLLGRGADPDATCESYGGGNGTTTLCLLVSSAGPAAAGVQVALVEELCHAGADKLRGLGLLDARPLLTQVPPILSAQSDSRVNGLDDDGLPLWTAVTFGYTAAAEALVRCGARVDNLIFASALGHLDSVRGYFDSDGGLRTGVTPVERVGAHGPALAPEKLIESALIWAAAHDRRQVVEFLLTKNPDLRVTEPCFNATALGAARYHGHDEMMALLEPLTSGTARSTLRPIGSAPSPAVSLTGAI